MMLQRKRYYVLWVCVCIAICSQSGSTVFFYIISLSHYLIIGTILEKKIEHKICFSSFSINFVWNFLFIIRPEWSTIINVFWFSCRVPVIVVRFLWSLTSLDRLLQNTQMLNFVKNPLCRSRVFFHEDRRTERQTDIKKLIFAFLIFLQTRLTLKTLN